MKKIYLTSMMLLALASCHNGDWHFDDYGARSVYFAYQYPVRTITLGEDPSTDNTLDNQHKCKIMATTGGGYTNPDDITVYFEVDETLCDNIVFTGTNNPVKAMPQNYYTLSSNSEMVIPAGKLSGGVEVQLTDDFFNDADAIKNTYVIPLRMTDPVGADTILQGKPIVENPNVHNVDHWDIMPKDYILYCVKYINPWHASYLRRGKDIIEGQAGHLSLSKEIVRHEKYVEEDEVMKLETKSMKEVTYSLYVEDESKK